MLKSENIVLPPGLEVERITPSSLTIEMERILERMVQVRADLAGPPPDGFEVDTVRVKPDSVLVRGPATILGEVTSLQTVPIVLRNLRLREGQASQGAPLVTVSPSIQLPELEKRQVQVSIRFRRQETRREEGAVRDRSALRRTHGDHPAAEQPATRPVHPPRPGAEDTSLLIVITGSGLYSTLYRSISRRHYGNRTLCPLRNMSVG